MLNNKQSAFSLIELLIVIFLSGLIVLGIVTIFVKLQQNFILQNEKANLYADAIYAENHLNQLTANAGYLACFSHRAKQIINHTLIDLDKPLRIAANGNAFDFYSADTELGILVDDIRQPNQLEIRTARKLKAGNIILIEDCQHAELVNIDNIMKLRNGKKLVSLTSTLKTKFLYGARVYQLKQQGFYFSVKKKALYYKVNNRSEQLIKHVKQFAIKLEPSLSSNVNILQLKLTLAAPQNPEVILEWLISIGLRNS